jgi:hypothetical protein
MPTASVIAMRPSDAPVRAAFAAQAEACRQLGSPFTAVLCASVGARLDRRTAIGRRILDWRGNPDWRGDSVPLRLAGGLHALVRRRRLPDLAALYPPHPLPTEQALWEAVSAALDEAEADLASWLDSAPQTNEVARSAPLMTGLLTIAAETRLPLELYELGASAGLNLLLDRYAYRLGGAEAGTSGSALVLAPAWEGPPPPGAPVEVLARRGVDLNPFDLRRAVDRERLLAYVWADQPRRLGRIEAAIGIAKAGPPQVKAGEAAAWLERHIGMAAVAGRVRVVMHTVAFQYFPSASQDRIAAHLQKVGAIATGEAPLAWLRFEIEPDVPEGAALRLTLWPDGRERLLAVGDPHGRRMRWLG